MTQPPAITLEPATEARWNTSLAVGPGATAFHDWAFLQAIAPALHCRFMPLIAVADGVDVGAVPFILRKRGPFQTANWTPFPYLGPVLADQRDLPRTLDAVDALARQERMSIVQLSTGPRGNLDSAVLESRGYEVTIDDTYMVPIEGRTSEDLWNIMDKRKRKAVRVAERSAIVPRPMEQRDTGIVLGRVINDALARHGMPGDYPEDAFGQVWQALAPTGRIHGFVGELDGEMVSAIISLDFGDQRFAWVQSTLTEHMSSAISTRLYWLTMAQAADDGCAALDFVGSPNAGIARFKKQLGSELLHFTVARKTTSRLYSEAQRAHRLLRTARFRLQKRPAKPQQ